LVAQDLFSFYHGNEPGNIPGMLPGPPADQYDYAHYYWWEAGAMWGTFVDYWHVTGDEYVLNERLSEDCLTEHAQHIQCRAHTRRPLASGPSNRQ